jgi:hypothetical protein
MLAVDCDECILGGLEFMNISAESATTADKL